MLDRKIHTAWRTGHLLHNAPSSHPELCTRQLQWYFQKPCLQILGVVRVHIVFTWAPTILQYLILLFKIKEYIFFTGLPLTWWDLSSSELIPARRVTVLLKTRVELLGIYPKDCDTGYSRGTCTPMFIAALYTIAKLWKQPRCPTTDE
jgi:hypothetical protein